MQIHRPSSFATDCARHRSRVPVHRIGDGGCPWGSGRPAPFAGVNRPAIRDAGARPTAKSGYGHGHRIGLLLENRGLPVSLVSRSTHWVSRVPITPIYASRTGLPIGHSEIACRNAWPERAADLRAASPRPGGLFLLDDGGGGPTMRLPASKTTAHACIMIGGDTEVACSTPTHQRAGPRAAS